MLRAYDGFKVVHVTASGNLQNALNDIEQFISPFQNLSECLMTDFQHFISPVLDFQDHWIQKSVKVFTTGHVAISGYLRFLDRAIPTSRDVIDGFPEMLDA